MAVSEPGCKDQSHEALSPETLPPAARQAAALTVSHAALLPIWMPYSQSMKSLDAE